MHPMLKRKQEVQEKGENSEEILLIRAKTQRSLSEMYVFLTYHL